MPPFKHPLAVVETELIGERTRIWAFAHILPGARIGSDCNICDQTFIENDVVIGDRVTIKCGVQIWDGITLEDDVFVGPNATFTNDKFPRSRHHEQGIERTRVRAGASIGANATILPGITIGRSAVIGAGAVVTRDVPPFAIVTGNPGRISGYVGGVATEPSRPAPIPAVGGIYPSRVKGVAIYRMPLIEDLRGYLSAGENIPFPIKRHFLVFKVPSREVRGEHAHIELHQFLVCVHGECRIVVDDSEHREEFILNSPAVGLHIPPMVWALQYQFTSDAVLLVLASDIYKAEDYIRDYDEFCKLRNAAAGKG